MDIQAFLDQVPALFPGDPAETDPIDPYWEDLKAEVNGYTSANELAILHLAATLLPEDEAYLEVGTFKGRSMCGSVRDNAGKHFYAMENFLEFGMTGIEARNELMSNLEKYAKGAEVELLEGDCFRLMAEPGIIDRPVGVYFYDGEHTKLAHYLALAAVEPLLADEALVLIDDATWPVVQNAHAAYIKNNPEWSIVATWDARFDNDPRWSNGLHALAFNRREPSRLSRKDEFLRRFQVSVQNRLNKFGWAMANRFPKLMKFAAGLVMSRSHTIESSDSKQSS